MSPKELLYMEDALSHEQMMQKKCTDLANMLQDQELKTFVTQLASRHQQTFGELYGLLK